MCIDLTIDACNNALYIDIEGLADGRTAVSFSLDVVVFWGVRDFAVNGPVVARCDSNKPRHRRRPLSFLSLSIDWRELLNELAIPNLKRR